MEACRHQIYFTCNDDNFWKKKLFIDFEPKHSIKYITNQGEAAGWKNLYIIFTYAEDFEYDYGAFTIDEFKGAANTIAAPELIDAYMNSDRFTDFMLMITLNSKTLNYLIRQYPQYRQYILLNLLLFNPEKVVVLMRDNPDINTKISDLALTAQSIDLQKTTNDNYPVISYKLRNALEKL